jgi:CBS domain-containing protein
MDLVGRAKRVRIYVNEGDVVHHKPVHLAILEFLRANNTAGATVLRAIEGFGGSGEIHSARVVDSDWKLPIVVEWIDASERVERLLPGVKKLVPRGLITVDETEVVLFSPLPVRDLSSAWTVSEAMLRDFPRVGPDAPVREVVEAVLGAKARGAVCVVEGGAPVGIITSSDLVRRGGVPVRLGLLATLDAPEVHAELERLAAVHCTAREIMTPTPVTVNASTPLVQAAALMARNHLKRAPVVDDAGQQVGFLRRIDLLRTVAERFDAAEPAALHTELRADEAVDRVMRADVPTVHPDTPLAVVLQAVISTRLSYAVVVDAERRPVGIVTDAELLERVTPTLRPSAVRALMHRLPFSHPDAETLATEQHARAKRAADLMSPDVPMVSAGAPLASAMASALGGRYKLALVVDGDGRLVGVVDHADILRGLVEPPAGENA